MNSTSYLALNAWLQKSDMNYISGRLLWFNLCTHGSCNLLWLSCEQIMKIVLIQKNVDDLASQCSNLDDIHRLIDREGKQLGHDVSKLINKIEIEYPNLAINKYKLVLEKLQEYFYRRYVVRGSSSIDIRMIDDVDEFYFMIRKIVEPEIGLGTIDEIFIQKKHNWGHPISAFNFAYLHNKSFSSRKHRVINIIGPNDEKCREDGM